LNIARALRHRNYRLFFAGQSISLVGTWITRVATSWLVYRLTGSELQLGIVSFAGQIPTLLLTPFAGVIVDRTNRHRILVVTQLLSLLQSAALAALTFTGLITVPQLLVLQVLQGIINAFDTPARQAFVVDMVADRRDLPNAIALNSTMVNGSRIVGPSIGGVLIAGFGEAWCFALDSISYVAVVASLLAMRLDPAAAGRRETNMMEELRAGWQYVSASIPIRTALLLLAIVSTFGTPYTVLMPAIAAHELNGGPNTLGLLMTATGVGALAGGVYLAQRETIVGLGRVVLFGTLTFGLGLIAFSLAHTLPLAMLLLAVTGFGFIAQMASTNTVVQTIVDERLRGRVMSFYTMAFFGTVPLGSLLAGVVADAIGSAATVRLGGVVCVGAGLWFAARLPSLRLLVRPIYVERGILPAPAADTGAKTL
jgi:MFS family permease